MTQFYSHLTTMLAGARNPIIDIFPRTELAPDEDRKMRLIYRHFFNDRINCVSEVQRTMWESRGIRHDLGRCDRQRVHEHFSFAPLRRKY